MTKFLLAAAGIAVAASAANAQFVSNIAVSDSTGPLADVLNGVSNNAYAGPSTLFNSLRIQGTLTSVLAGTFASEARWNIRNTAYAGGGVNFQSTGTGGYTGSLAIDATFTGLLQWANTGDNFRFESFESFDDGAGVDSQWTNTTHTYDGAVSVTNLGNFAGGAFDINTFTSTFDTELGLYTAAGIRLADNDDAAAGLQSQILSTLGDGTYYIVVGGFNSVFVDGTVLAGAAAGNFNLNVNGSTVASGALATRTLAVYSFTIPAPGAAALLGLGGLLAARRRRA